MALFKRSSCEDYVDRFNHSWFVIFLLIMAVVMFFLPFGLPQSGRPQALTKYSAHCWCPAQYERSHRDYTNAVCAAAFARTRSTRPPNENDNNKIDAAVFAIPTGDIRLEHEPSETFIAQPTDTNAYYFILEHTPLFLLISAVVIRFVHVLFLLFVSWCGVNLGSLTETWRSLITDRERGAQCQQAFLQDLSKKLRNSRRLTLGYLVYKLTICFLCVIFALVLYCSILPRIYLLDGNHHSIDLQGVVDPKSESFNLICTLNIRQLTNLHSYAVQCLITVQPDDHSRMVTFYKPFYLALLFTMVIIALVNAINWTLWVVKLCRSQSTKRSGKSLPLSARLLVYLVAERGDFTAAEKLEEGLFRVQKGSELNDELNKETEDL